MHVCAYCTVWLDTPLLSYIVSTTILALQTAMCRLVRSCSYYAQDYVLYVYASIIGKVTPAKVFLAVQPRAAALVNTPWLGYCRHRET